MTEHRIFCGDCLELMQRKIKDNSIDMILCDLPYGTTQNKWDSVISFALLWKQYERVCKPSTAIVLSAAQPFTSTLVVSKLEWFKYDWVWRKPKGTGHLNAKKQPMRDKEDILVFYREQCVYNPQFTDGTPFGNKRGSNTPSYGEHGALNYQNDGKRYPKQVIEFGVVERGTLHPTQKPVNLWSYLIKTYTNEGNIILDNCCGSGTTGVAAKQLRRHSIQMDISQEYCEIAKRRLEETEEGKG